MRVPAGDSELEVCQGPDCTETFRPARSGQKYHHPNCRKRAYKARERQKQAAFVLEELFSTEKIADALKKYDCLKEEGKL